MNLNSQEVLGNGNFFSYLLSYRNKIITVHMFLILKIRTHQTHTIVYNLCPERTWMRKQRRTSCRRASETRVENIHSEIHRTSYLKSTSDSLLLFLLSESGKEAEEYPSKVYLAALQEICKDT